MFIKLLKYAIIIAIIIFCLGAIKYRQKIIDRILLLKFEALTFQDTGALRPLLYRKFSPRIITDNKYPLVLYLHGGGKRGQNNRAQIDDRIKCFVSKETQKRNPCFVVAPQCPTKTQWVNVDISSVPLKHYNQNTLPESDEMKMIIKLIDDLVAKHPIDTNRIYVTGISMGSSGTWDIITRYPNLFAAAVPVSGVSDTSLADRLTHIPIWAFTGSLDNLAPPALNEKMVGNIADAGGVAKVNVIKGQGHNCYKFAFENYTVLEWMFNQTKTD